MKPLLSLFVILLITASCEKPEPTISGTANDIPNGIRMYLTSNNAFGTETIIDTAIVMNGTFDFGIQKTDSFNGQLFLKIDGNDGILTFVSESEPIQINVKKDSLYASDVNGGIENELFNQYRDLRIKHTKKSVENRQEQQKVFETEGETALDPLKKQQAEFDNQLKDELKGLIEKNPNNMVAPVALEYLFATQYIDEIETRNFYNTINTKFLDNPVMININMQLEKIELTAIGKKAPYFEGKNPIDEVIKLPEVLGKLTLINFWASWCVDCREQNLALVEAYNEYHDKGFNIISVSLDKKEEREKWIAAINEDQMEWNHISRLEYWNDPIARLYNVAEIPANLLLDENGIIIDKNLKGEALENRLADLLN